MRVSEDIRMNIKNNKVTVLVVLDIKSAYPSVSHEMLIKILNNYGISYDSQKWIESFLNNKIQIVELNDQRSNEIKITCGLLQGDNLSQSFFSLVIIDIIYSIKFCKAHLYADDLAIYLEIDIENFNESINKINDDIIRINEFISMRGMKLNPTKSQAIIVGSAKSLSIINNNIEQLSKIKVCNLEIEYTKSVKYLGFNFNSEFNSEAHINSIIKNVNFVLSKIKHCRNSLSTDIKLKLFKGVINPFFDYCAIMYHGYGVYGTGIDQNRLRVLYNSCIRFVCNLSGRDHISNKYLELNLLNDYNRRSFLICVIIHSFRGVTRGRVFGFKPPLWISNIQKNYTPKNLGFLSFFIYFHIVLYMFFFTNFLYSTCCIQIVCCIARFEMVNHS